MRLSFDVIEVQLPALAVLNVEEANSTGLRRNHPQLLVCRLPAISHSAVVLSAPLDHYLSGLRGYPLFESSISRYTSAVMVPSQAVYEGFLDELRRAKLPKDDFPKTLFLPYGGWGGFTAKMHPPLGKLFRALRIEKRLAGWLVPDGAVEGVIEYFQSMIQEFEALSFVSAPESLNAIVSAPGFSELPSRSSVPYESPDYDAIALNVFSSTAQQRSSLARVKCLIEETQTLRWKCLNLFPLHLAKVSPSLHFIPGGPPGDLARELAYHRSELLRRLELVWHFPAAYDYARSAHRSPTAALEGADAEAQSAIGDNVEHFLDTMERRYPVLRSDPMAALGGAL